MLRRAGQGVGVATGWRALIALALLSLAACTTRYVPPPNVMRVENRGHQTIRSLSRQPCEEPSQAPTVLPGTTIAPAHEIEIPLLHGCVNLFAFDDQGRAAGEQLDLRMQPGATWRIQ